MKYYSNPAAEERRIIITGSRIIMRVCILHECQSSVEVLYRLET